MIAINHIKLTHFLTLTSLSCVMRQSKPPWHIILGLLERGAKWQDGLPGRLAFNFNSWWISCSKMNRILGRMSSIIRDSTSLGMFLPLSGSDLNVLWYNFSLYTHLNNTQIEILFTRRGIFKLHETYSKPRPKSSCRSNLQIELHPPLGCHSFSGPWNYIIPNGRWKPQKFPFFTRSRASHVIMKPKSSCGDLGSGWVM